jgi:hypothetical protein
MGNAWIFAGSQCGYIVAVEGVGFVSPLHLSRAEKVDVEERCGSGWSSFKASARMRSA